MTLELDLCQNKTEKPELFAKALRNTRCNCVMKADFLNDSILKNVLFEWKSSKYFLFKGKHNYRNSCPFMLKYSNETNRQANNNYTTRICGSGKWGRADGLPLPSLRGHLHLVGLCRKAAGCLLAVATAVSE